jgi:hypothetical protein
MSLEWMMIDGRSKERAARFAISKVLTCCGVSLPRNSFRRLNTSFNGRTLSSIVLLSASLFLSCLLTRPLTTIPRTQYQTPLKLDTPTAKPATRLYLCFLRHHRYQGPLFAHRLNVGSQSWSLIALSVSSDSLPLSRPPRMQKAKS